MEELEKYKSVYEQVLLCPDSTIATLTNSFNRTPHRGLNNLSASPFFPQRSTPLSSSLTPSAFSSGTAVTKVQLSAAASRLVYRHRALLLLFEVEIKNVRFSLPRDVIILKPNSIIFQIFKPSTPSHKGPQIQRGSGKVASPSHSFGS